MLDNAAAAAGFLTPLVPSDPLKALGLGLFMGMVITLLTPPCIAMVNFMRRRIFYNNKNTLLKKYGEWAVITGATDGIGKSTAIELSKRGFKVVLISRSEEKLKDMNIPGAKLIAVDFSQPVASYKNKVADGLKGLDIGILINNVGMSYDFPEFFHELTDEKVANLIDLNIQSTTWMTRIVLPSMLERKEKKLKSAIVNVGSAAGLHPNPLLSEYGACKSYVSALTDGLAAEYAPMGIEVSCYTPYFIVSKLSKYKNPSFSVPTPDTYAKLICNSIGSGGIQMNPYIPHAVMGYVLTRLPNVSSMIRNMHLGIRKKGQAKRDAQKKNG